MPEYETTVAHPQSQLLILFQLATTYPEFPLKRAQEGIEPDKQGRQLEIDKLVSRLKPLFYLASGITQQMQKYIEEALRLCASEEYPGILSEYSFLGLGDFLAIILLCCFD